MQYHQPDLVKMSHLSEKEQQFCSSRIDKPHKFSYETNNWWLDAALTYVRKGDILVVWRLDRLGRSLPHLITTMTSLEERGIGFKSLTENIDTTTSGGKLIFHIFGALAEFERNLIRERTTAGLLAARERGRTGGRPKVLTGKNSVLPRISTISETQLQRFV